MTVSEYWNDPLRRPHPIGCRCAPDGRCEQAQAVAEERAERREMAGSDDV